MTSTKNMVDLINKLDFYYIEHNKIYRYSYSRNVDGIDKFYNPGVVADATIENLRYICFIYDLIDKNEFSEEEERKHMFKFLHHTYEFVDEPLEKRIKEDSSMEAIKKKFKSMGFRVSWRDMFNAPSERFSIFYETKKEEK